MSEAVEEKGNGLAKEYRSLLWGLVVLLVIGSYGYTYTVTSAMDTMHLDARETVKKDIKEQTTELKKDLKERIQETELRVLQALDQLRRDIQSDRRGDRNR